MIVCLYKLIILIPVSVKLFVTTVEDKLPQMTLLTLNLQSPCKMKFSHVHVTFVETDVGGQLPQFSAEML